MVRSVAQGLCWAVVLALSGAACAARKQAADFDTAVREMQGRAAAAPDGDGPFPLGPMTCTYRLRQAVSVNGAQDQDWREEYAHCGERTVVLLTHESADKRGRRRRFIVDTLLLPPLAPSRDLKINRPFLYHASEGRCQLRGRPDTSFLALVQRGDGREIDWRSGIEQAWTFDIAGGRILPVPPLDIRCE